MLARFFIDRPVLAWVISIVIILLGDITRLSFLPDRRVSGDHAADRRVAASYPGASSRRSGRHGGRASIEQQVVGVEGMMYISSQRQLRRLAYALDVT